MPETLQHCIPLEPRYLNPEPFSRFHQPQYLVRFDIVQYLNHPSRPGNLQFADGHLRAEAEVDAFVARRHETHAGGDVVVKDTSRPSHQLEGGSNSVPVALFALSLDPEPMVAVPAGIDQDSRTLVERGNDQIGESVMVEVSRSGAALKSLPEKVGAQFLRDVHKGFSPLVFPQGIMLSRVGGR